METFMPRVSPAVATPDPSKHVKYTVGMVLGVDDFEQEFAYLSGRNQWLARDVLGYGTVTGLKIRIEEGKDERGPRVLIEPGVALSPRGQLIRVAPAQCAYLNPWIKANQEEVSKRLGSSPPAGDVRLYVVLCYRACETELLPIPGEPCRSEDELRAPSRLADDFHLELRFDAPEQQEEDALRDFVDWLRQIEIVDTSSTSLEDFLNAIRESAHLRSALTSPPSSPPSPPLSSPLSPPDFMFGSPPLGLSIPTGRAWEYLRAAFRVWVTELRPLWRPNWFGDWRCCDQKEVEHERRPEECLLLSELVVPVRRGVLTDGLEVGDLRHITVNEERRPFLVHLRLLQEWLLCGRSAHDRVEIITMHAELPAAGQVVAAGTFDGKGLASFSFGGLRVFRNTEDPTLYLLTGTWFQGRGAHYVVKGTPVGDPRNKLGQTFEVILDAERIEGRDIAKTLRAFDADVGRGLVVQVINLNSRDKQGNGFSVEISRFPG